MRGVCGELLGGCIKHDDDERGSYLLCHVVAVVLLSPRLSGAGRLLGDSASSSVWRVEGLAC